MTPARTALISGNTQASSRERETYGFFDSEEAMAQPTPRGAVAADVREAVLVEAVRRAEGNLFDRLVHEQTLRGRGGERALDWNVKEESVCEVRIEFTGTNSDRDLRGSMEKSERNEKNCNPFAWKAKNTSTNKERI